MPVVNVQSSPNGLPIASVFWPTLRSWLLPIGSGRVAFCHVDLDDAEIVIGAHITNDRRGDVASVAQTPFRAGSACDHMEIRHDVPSFVPGESGTRSARNVKHVPRSRS